LGSEVSYTTQEIIQEQRLLQLKAIVTSELNKWNEIYTNCKSYNNMLEEAETRPERHVDLINFLKTKEAYWFYKAKSCLVKVYNTELLIQNIQSDYILTFKKDLIDKF
jgi:hypothetical protein